MASHRTEWSRSFSTRTRALLIGLVGLMVLALLPSAVRTPSKLHLSALPEMAKAQKTGKPVEVMSQRTTTETTWANPDGHFRREISAVPVRARVGDKWVSVDLDLVRRRDGSVSPKAAPEPTVLSGGGRSPLLTSTIGGVQIATGWPGRLPVPTLKGPTATYPDVFAGVDLRMTVTPAGTSQVLVVSNRDAANNPALRTIKLHTAVSGGVLRPANGGFEVVDANGRQVGVAPQPQMWDSTKPAGGDHETSAASLTAPPDGGSVAAVGLSVGKASLTLHPDASKLSGPGVTYPVMIDPQISATTVSWTGIRQQNPTASYYKWTYDNLHAGYQGTQLQRLFWSFNTSSLANATVLKATFVGNLEGTYDCDPRSMQLWKTSAISSTTSWNNQPSWSTLLNTFNDQAASGCGVYGNRVEVPITAAVASVATAGTTSMTFGLRAATESSTYSAKWFDHEAALNVIYSFPPDVPTQLSLIDPTVGCSSPAPVIGGVEPRVSATLSSPDDANLQVKFEAYVGATIPAGGVAFWSETTSADSAQGGRFISATRIHKPDGTLPDGTYTWRVQAVDPDADFTDVATGWVTCTFTVDSGVVGPPGLLVPNGTVWSVDANPVSVTLDPTANVDDPTPATFGYYRWSVNSQTPTSENVLPIGVDKRAQIAVAPTKAGPNVLRIWAYNTAGSVSTPTSYMFDASGGTSGYASQYFFDEGTGATVADQTAAQALSGVTGLWVKRGSYRTDGAVPAANKSDYLLRFAGTEAPPQTTGSAVATNQSFTVSAWVRPDDIADRVAVSEGTSTQSNFTLGASTSCAAPAQGCYRFGVRNSAGTMVYAESTRTLAQDQVTPPTLPRMIHLVGDISAAGVIRLRIIVDGVIVENRTTSSAPSQVSNGPLLIGAARVSSAYVNKWKGDIDNVMVKQGLLDDVALVQLDAADGGRCYSSDRIDQGPTPCAS